MFLLWKQEIKPNQIKSKVPAVQWRPCICDWVNLHQSRMSLVHSVVGSTVWHEVTFQLSSVRFLQQWRYRSPPGGRGFVCVQRVGMEGGNSAKGKKHLLLQIFNLFEPKSIYLNFFMKQIRTRRKGFRKKQGIGDIWSFKVNWERNWDINKTCIYKRIE